MKIKNSHSGISILVSIIVISAVALFIALGAASIGLDETQNALRRSKFLETLLAADSCIEQASAKLRTDVSYAGGTIASGNTSCAVTVAGSGTARTVTVLATQGTAYSRKLDAVFDWTNGYKITNWRDVTD